MQSIPICCRPFFVEGECLMESQSKILQYKNYEFPYDQERQTQLKKAICGMLNTEGGYIFTGIRETPERKRIVSTQIYSQDLKENILKYYRLLGKFIKPTHVIIKELIEFEFVPIRSKNGGKFIKGGYVFRIRVKKGDRKSLYFFTQKNQDFFFKRTKNQTLRLKTQDALDQFRSKIQSQQYKEPESQLHPGKCKLPDQGEQDFSQSKLKQVFPRDIERYDQVRNKSGDHKTNEQSKGNNDQKKNSIFPANTQANMNVSSFKNEIPKQFLKINNPQQTGNSWGPQRPGPVASYSPSRISNRQDFHQVYVLINFSPDDFANIFNQKRRWRSVETLRSSFTDVVIVLVSADDMINFKETIDQYIKKNERITLLMPTRKLSFEKVNLDPIKIQQCISEIIYKNNFKNLKYYRTEQILECPNPFVCAKIYLQFAEMGKKPRFKN